MKIRRYIGNNSQEAILKVKMDLGNDAIILNTRKVRKKGIFKIFSKPLVEVLAAVDEDSGKESEDNTDKNNSESKDIHTNVNGSNNIQHHNNIKPQDNVEQQKVLEYQGANQPEEDQLIDYNRIMNLENKVSNMENVLKKIYLQVTNDEDDDSTEEQQKSKVSELFNNTLLKNEVDVEIVEKILQHVQEEYGDDPNMNDAATSIYNYIANILGDVEPIKLDDNKKQHKVIFIGPTGVGKTTTIAKLAAEFVLNQKKNIGLVTADTYRIAAVDQLKTYAEILNIPVNVVYSPSEIENAIKEFSDKDVILIDTAGRSHRKKNQMEELKNVVEVAKADEAYMVVSANTRPSDFKEIIDIYGFMPDYKIVITKIDETNSMGNVLNIKYYSGKPLAYITTGQSVPDDIEVLNVDKITRCIMGSMRYDGSS